MKTKMEKLSQVKAQLKKEFIGIDEVIDKVIESITSWYLIPEMNDRPVIVNLWGLTGTGKTSLVNRLIELLEINKYLYLDLGKSNVQGQSLYNNNTVDSALSELSEFEKDVRSYIFVLDEFQHAKTLDERRIEIDKPQSRSVWELLDSGKVSVTSFNRLFSRNYYEALSEISIFKHEGIKIINGIVPNEYISKIDEITGSLRKFKTSYLEDCKDYTIVSLDLRCGLRDVDENLDSEFTEFLYNCSDIDDLLNELRRIKDIIDKPKVMDCSKSLVFVLGNLDEVYPMHGDFNPDIDADEYYEMTKKININDIKRCLKSRFRSEQISRLGNNHILYPSLKKDSFQKIIKLILENIKNKYEKRTNLLINFDESIEKLLYSESVYPVQGVRPIFTTVNNIISSKLPETIIKSEIEYKDCVYINCKCGDNLYNDDILIEFEYFDENNNLLGVSTLVQELELGRLRKNKNKDSQVITGVHESGHSIVYTSRTNKSPKSIVSVSSVGGGFITKELEYEEFGNIESLKTEVMVGLAGRCAEEIVFGKDNISFGASNDFQKITDSVSRAFYKYGLYKNLLFWNKGFLEGYPYGIPDEITENKITKEIMKFISECEADTIKILSNERTLLKSMGLYLSNHRSMDNKTYLKYIDTFSYSMSVDTIDKEDTKSKYKDLLEKFS